MSLIETVIAFTVLLMLVLFVMSLVPSSLLSLGRGHHQLVAGNLAQELLEEQRQLSFSQLTDTAGSDLTASIYTLDDGFVFTPRLQISDVAPDTSVIPTPPIRAKLVRITVRWQERAGQEANFRESMITPVSR